MRFVAFCHGKGKEEHEKWGADLTESELLQKVTELPGTSIFSEHDNENGGKLEDKSQIGKVIDAWIDPETKGLKVMGEIDTTRFKGYTAWNKLQKREFIGTSLSHDILYSISPIVDIVGKPIVELSLTKSPLRKEALVTHIEKESDELLEKKQFLKQIMMDEKLKRKQYNQTKSGQGLNTEIPKHKIVFPKMSSNQTTPIQTPTPTSTPTATASADTQSQTQTPQSQSQSQSQQQQQPQAQPFPQFPSNVPEERMKQALRLLEEQEKAEKQYIENFSKETLSLLDEGAGFIASTIQNIQDGSKFSSLKDSKVKDAFVEEVKRDPHGTGDLVRLFAQCSNDKLALYNQANEAGKVVEAVKKQSHMELESERQKSRETEARLKKELEDMKRMHMMESEKFRIASSQSAFAIPSATATHHQGPSFNERFNTEVSSSLQQQESGAPKFPKTRLSTPVIPAGLPPVDQRGRGALEKPEMLKFFTSYNSTGSWNEYIPNAEIDPPK